MKHVSLAVGVSSACLLLITVAHASHCCPAHRPAGTPETRVQARSGGHAHDRGVARPAPRAAEGAGKEKKLQTVCPVMGGAIDKALFVDHAGKRIFVCCQSCVATVRNDPVKYIKAMESAGITLHAARPTGSATEPKKPTTGDEGHRR